MRRSSLWLCLLLLVFLGAMVAKTRLVDPPPLRGANTPGQFDAKRAAGRLALILGDQRPHPSDSPASDAVRDRLVGQLRALGLQPVIRDQLACNELYKARGVSCARVRNVIAVIGRPRGQALLLNAHYDSTPVGPGAGDDGVGVATLLEVAAILQHRPPARPVIVLFNEGEELGLIGARAFLADPLSQNVDGLVNLEARGVSGPANMFETSRPNAAAIAAYAASVERPVANSLSTDVYRLMPNYTDVNSFSERGWTTLNLAIIGNETRYHSPGDTVDALRLASLQHMGDQTLALAKHMANAAPRAPRSDRIFMDVAGHALVTLPLAGGIALLTGLLIVFAWLTLRRGGAARGAAVVAGTLLSSTALSWAALAILGAVRGGMFWRAYPMWTHSAVYASVMLAGAAWLATVGRATTIGQLRAIFWLIYLLAGGLIGIVAPGGIVYFLFPPLIGAAGCLLSRTWPAAERVASSAAILVLFVTWGALLALLEELLNSGPMWIFAPLGALLILPALIEAKPLIDDARLRSSAMVAGALALLAWSAAAAAPAYSADRQQRFGIEHVTDVRSGKAVWSVLNGGDPLPHAYRRLGDWRRGKLPYADQKRWLTSAPAEPRVRAPALTSRSVVRNGTERAVTVRLMANGAERIALVAAEDAQIRAAGVPGFVRPIDASAADGKYWLSCSGRSCDGLELTIVTTRTRPIKLILIGTRSGLPVSAAPLVRARPRLARPQYAPDQSIAFSQTTL